MTNDWTEVSINTTTIAGELLSDFLLEEGAKGIVLGEWTPENLSETPSEYTTVKAYMSFDYENLDSLEDKIQKQLKSYSQSGLKVGAKEVLIKKVKEDEWSSSWKKYFHVTPVGENFIIKPLWEDYQKNDKDLVINFDPAMAFGTGTHPSTHLCLEKLEQLSSNLDKNINVLDLGTGSGVLSIALSLLGFKKITAIDIDAVAIKASEENFKINNLEINLFKGELKDCKDIYGLILGNLLSEIIESLANDIYEKLNPNGLFIGAGIVKRKENDVINSLKKVGLELQETKYYDDWVLVLFKKP